MGLFGSKTKQTEQVKVKFPKNLNLTKDEKAALQAAYNKARPMKVMSAQESLPFHSIMPSGLCRIDENIWSRTVSFGDINYQLATREMQETIFEEWCDFLDYFSEDIDFQLTFLSLPADEKSVRRSIYIPDRGDAFNDIRREYMVMLQNQLARGNNGIVRSKYLTFSVEARDFRSAKSRLERIEADVRSNFKRFAVSSQRMDGKAVMQMCHDVLTMTSSELVFDYKWLTPMGLTEKDFIVPNSFTFSHKNTFLVDDTLCTASFIEINAAEMKDRVLKNLLDLEFPQIFSIHCRSVSKQVSLKQVKRIVSDLDKIRVDEQKKAARSGYDMDILPPELEQKARTTKSLLEALSDRDENMFNFTMLAVTTGRTKKELNNNFETMRGVLGPEGMVPRKLDYQQEQAYFSCLPFAQNAIDIQRTQITGSLAGLIPFTSAELFQRHEEALYCGLNALTNNMIMVDRKLLKNPNGLILGTPGSGKSFSAKREIVNVFLVTDDDIIICDPEAEYAPLVLGLDGQIIKISSTSKDYINPMDLSMTYGDDSDDILKLKSDFILSLFELITKDTLLPQDISIIDRCLQRVYAKYFENQLPENMPTLGDLYEEIGRQPEHEAIRLKASLEIYVTGSLNVFNHRTNVDLRNRVVCFDIKELGSSSLKKIGMLIVQDQVWNRVSENRSNKKRTRYYMDEFHLLLVDKQTAQYSASIWKRFRKWGGIPTGITQNIKDFLSSPEVGSIFDNTDYVYLLNQGADDRRILAKQLDISPYQIAHVTNSNAGEGLIIYDKTILPFVDQFPMDTKMYQLMTTKLSEM